MLMTFFSWDFESAHIVSVLQWMRSHKAKLAAASSCTHMYKIVWEILLYLPLTTPRSAGNVVMMIMLAGNLICQKCKKVLAWILLSKMCCTKLLIASWGCGKTSFIFTASCRSACRMDLYIVPRRLLAANAVFVSTTGWLCPSASSLGSVNILLEVMYLCTCNQFSQRIMIVFT